MASSTALALSSDAPTYERHRPEQTPLYALIDEHFPRFLQRFEAEGVSLPQFVKEEFEAFLKCGRLEYGFLRVKCDACRNEKLVAFSCKRRGFCPSCGARRMVETAAHLVEHVLPEQPIRQWVLSFPHPLRFLFATRPAVLSQVLGIVYRAISTFLIRRAGLRVGAGARTGAVTLIQRFGSALNLNIHLHMLFVDGVYTFDDERPRLHRGCAPAQPELQRLLRAIATRVTRALERQGLLIRDDETPSFDLEPDDGFEQLLGAAVHYRIATGPHTGRKALTLRTVASNPLADNPCIAQLSGFSLHSPPEWCNRGSARAAEPMSGTLSNACAATSPAQHSRTNASRSMTAGRSCIDSSTPSVTGPLMSCSTRWNSCGTSVCRTPSGQPPAVQIGNPADLASPASSPLKCRSRSELALCRVPAPISPDTTACSPRTSSTAAVSSPNLPIKPPASLMRLVPRP